MRTGPAALALLCASGALGRAPASPVAGLEDGRARALPLALPDDTRTKLVLQPEAVAWLRGLRGPVALVSIIGPYRSGKSFLLNRLLDVPCERGFTVGHRRTTQTKGVWLWSAPMPGTGTGEEGARASVRFLDTEGIEGAGASAVYDDRVFSLAALLSSALVYNLPETIREDDVAKLVFVAELAHEFGRRVGGGGRSADAAGARHGWTPPALLWLLQRDFLQGAGAAAHAVGVFRDVDGIGVPQPSLERTRLCELAAARALPAAYAEKLRAVSAWVRAHAEPLAVGAEGGAGLADLAARALDALNAQEIPSVASVVSTFNAQLVARCARAHADGLRALRLPLDEAALAAAEAALRAEAERTLLAQSFGANHSLAELATLCAAAAAARRDANFKASHEACAAGWAACEPALGALRGALLPSRARLDAALARCNASLAPCAGPAAGEYGRRAAAAAAAAAADVGAQYDGKLTAVLSCGALGLVGFGRFSARSGLLEGVGWLLLFALEIAPRLDVLGGGRERGGGARLLGLAPGSARAKAALGAYERAVYNEWYDADALLPWAPLGVGACALARLARARRRRRAAPARERARGAAGAAAGGGGGDNDDYGGMAAGEAPVVPALFGGGFFGGGFCARVGVGGSASAGLSQVTVHKDE